MVLTPDERDLAAVSPAIPLLVLSLAAAAVSRAVGAGSGLVRR